MRTKLVLLLLILPLLIHGRLFKKTKVTYEDRITYRGEFTEYFLGSKWNIPDILEKEFTKKALEECKAIHDKIKSCMDRDLIGWYVDQGRIGQWLFVYYHNGSNFEISSITFRIYINESTTTYNLGILGIQPYRDAEVSTQINTQMYNEIKKTEKARGGIKIYWWK